MGEQTLQDIIFIGFANYVSPDEQNGISNLIMNKEIFPVKLLSISY